jgi:ribonuclease D
MKDDLPDPILVQDGRGLERLLEDLDRQTEIAFDTEADSFFNYREKVCLIQVTAEDRDYLVDPLAKLDVTPLGRVLGDPARTVVFHDGEYDILILKRDFGFSFAGLFDTRVAAAALGSSTPGLASVLAERFGIEMDKSMQRSNWSARPLSEKQVRYARLDTRFLIPLMHQQRVELEEKNRTRIVEGECRRLEALEPAPVHFQPDDFVRVKGARTLDGEGQQALRELFSARDTLARELDLPPFKVLNNEALVGLARARPRSEREVGDRLSPRQARRVGPAVIEAIRRADELGPLKRLPTPRRAGTPMADEEYDVHEALKQWRKGVAQREDLDASLVLNRHVMARLASAMPRSAAELAAVEGVLDWQVEMFAEGLVQAIADARERFEREGPSRARSGSRKGRGNRGNRKGRGR